MEIRNTIDVQQLKVTPQDADNTYLGIDENGQLVRTKIELSGTGGGDVNLDDYYTKAEVDVTTNRINDDVEEIKKNKWGIRSGDGVIAGNYGTYTVGDLKTINGESLIGDTDIELITINGYNQLKGSIDNHTEKISDIEDDVDEIKNNKWGIRSGDGVIAGNYGTYTVGDLKTINGQSLIGTEDIVIEGSSGGGTIVELTSSKPTLDEFNILYESAAAGKPTYVKYNEGVFNIIADNNSITNRGLYHFYADAFNIYIVFWYNQTNNNTVYEVRSELVNASSGIKNIKDSSKDDIKLYSVDSYSKMPTYFEDYSRIISAPISTYKGKSGTFLLDGKMYYFDVVNGERDGIYVKPKIVDLLNISGGDVNLDDYYTKTEIDDMIGDINNILETI